MQLGGILEALVVYVVPTVLAITLHEAAHGFVALAFGDTTAKQMGRVTLNPFKHVDPFGTVILPLMLFISKAPFLFGYAKPVPVRAQSLNSPRFDMIWVALAGPAMNIVLAFVSMMLLHGVSAAPSGWQTLVREMLVFSVSINVLLAVFNLIPIPPLDGSRILSGVLPPRWSSVLDEIEPYGLWILLGLMFVPVLMGIKPSPLSWYLQHSSAFVKDWLVRWSGLG